MTLKKRILRLEAKAAEQPAEAFVAPDFSNASDEDLEWMEETLLRIMTANNTLDYDRMTVDEMRRLEWLMTRASKSAGIAAHKADCRCYYCQPLGGVDKFPPE